MKTYKAILRVIRSDEYRVKFVKSLKNDLGQIHYDTNTILICTKDPEEILTTFVHELLHAAYEKDSETEILRKERELTKWLTFRHAKFLTVCMHNMARG